MGIDVLLENALIIARKWCFSLSGILYCKAMEHTAKSTSCINSIMTNPHELACDSFDRLMETQMTYTITV